MNHFTEAIVLPRYTLYMQDYGGPVGFRMALSHPERINALIVQNAVAHNEGLGTIWKARRAFWADRETNEKQLRTNLLSLATTRTRHVGEDPSLERYDPDLWTDEFAFLNQPGQAEIQSDLFYDYGLTSIHIPSGRLGCRRSSLGCWSSGGNSIPLSLLQNPKHIVAMCRTPKFTFSTRVILRWTLLPTRSLRC